MKRWQIFALLMAAVLVAGYFYYRGALRTERAHTSTASEYSSADLGGPAHINWQQISRPDDGFRIEMPADPRDLQVPAYNETGGTEPVKMIFSNPDGDTTFAVTWLDNPPVARVNNDSPDRTLDQARDGMLARTQTTAINEAHVSVGGFPARDITARNSEGGYLDARLILANSRLYTLMAVFPSSNARREQDVIRFYNSFTPLRPNGVSPKGNS
ncbi:MAG TPA: hypothetical protein VKB38_04225 [Terracidiphilus sp.]|nr:hypothetical protein [Terracidiphilus sp.]